MASALTSLWSLATSLRSSIFAKATLAAQRYPLPFFWVQGSSIKVTNPPKKGALINIWLLGYQATDSLVIMS